MKRSLPARRLHGVCRFTLSGNINIEGTTERPEYWLPLVAGCGEVYNDDTAESRRFLEQLIESPQSNARLRELAAQLRKSLDAQRARRRAAVEQPPPEPPSAVEPSADFAVRPVTSTAAEKGGGQSTLQGRRCQPAGDSVDFFFNYERSPGRLFLMKEKGILKPVGPNIDHCEQVVFDGRYVWLATGPAPWSPHDAPRVLAIDPATERYCEFTEKEGLSLPSVRSIPGKPYYTYRVRIAPVAPGKVCIVAGYGRAWIAMVTLDPEGNHKVNVFLRAVEAQTRNDLDQWKKTTVAFVPKRTFTLEGPGNGKDSVRRKVLIDRGHHINLVNLEVASHPLIVDAETLAIEVVPRELRLPERVEVHQGALYWVGRVAPSYDQLGVVRASLPDLTPKLVMALEKNGRLFFTGEQVHVAGKQWWTGRLGDSRLKCLGDVPWTYFNVFAGDKFDPKPASRPDYRPLGEIAQSSHYGILVNHDRWCEPALQVLLGEEARKANAEQGGRPSGASAVPTGSQNREAETSDAYAGRVSALFHVQPRVVEDARVFASLQIGNRACGAVVAASPDGRCLAVGLDKGFLLCSAETRKILHVMRGDGGTIKTLAFTPDGTRLVSCGESLRIWDVAGGKQLMQMPQQQAGIGGVLLSPDGKRLIVGKAKAFGVSVWDLQTLECLYETSVIRRWGGFLPDGALLANANDTSESLVAWDVARGTCRQILGYSLGWPLAVSPDGKRLATLEYFRAQGDELAGSDRVLVWDLARQRVLLAIDRERGECGRLQVLARRRAALGR